MHDLLLGHRHRHLDVNLHVLVLDALVGNDHGDVHLLLHNLLHVLLDDLRNLLDHVPDLDLRHLLDHLLVLDRGDLHGLLLDGAHHELLRAHLRDLRCRVLLVCRAVDVHRLADLLHGRGAGLELRGRAPRLVALDVRWDPLLGHAAHDDVAGGGHRHRRLHVGRHGDGLGRRAHGVMVLHLLRLHVHRRRRRDIALRRSGIHGRLRRGRRHVDRRRGGDDRGGVGGHGRSLVHGRHHRHRSRRLSGHVNWVRGHGGGGHHHGRSGRRLVHHRLRLVMNLVRRGRHVHRRGRGGRHMHGRDCLRLVHHRLLMRRHRLRHVLHRGAHHGRSRIGGSREGTRRTHLHGVELLPGNLTIVVRVDPCERVLHSRGRHCCKI
mmetsp:Transcript_71862/g.202946  ORF Transcript_71862/g.202946 Transcript_71862/m.202946 type:complete len:377 (+) Transcript_71862:1-1131(+)